MKKIFKTMVLTTAVTLGALSPSQAEVKKVIKFGILATEASFELKKSWEPVLKDWSKKLGVEVKGFYSTDYAALVQAMRFGKIDVAHLGNKSGIEAVDRANGEVFAKSVFVGGDEGYYSLLITHKDRKDLNNIQDVFKKRKSLIFGNGDPNSTSGYLIPSYYVFTKNNVDVSDFKRVLNSSHGNNIIAVENKKVDFATNNTGTLKEIVNRYPEKLKNIKVIWKSPIIPSDPFVWRKDLNRETKNALYNLLMTYPETALEKVKVAKVNIEKWTPGNDAQLITVRQLVLFKKLVEAKKSNDTKEKIDELNAKLDELSRKVQYFKYISSKK